MKKWIHWSHSSFITIIPILDLNSCYTNHNFEQAVLNFSRPSSHRVVDVPTDILNIDINYSNMLYIVDSFTSAQVESSTYLQKIDLPNNRNRYFSWVGSNLSVIICKKQYITSKIDT